MAKYLVSFPGAAMVVPEDQWEAVGRDAHAVIDEAKAAGAKACRCDQELRVFGFDPQSRQQCPPAETGGPGRISRLGQPGPAVGRTKGKAGDDVRRPDCRIVAFDRSVSRQSNLRTQGTYLSWRAFAAESRGDANCSPDGVRR